MTERTPLDPDNILVRPVADCDFNSRARGAMKAADITYLGDLVQKTEGEILKEDGFGRISLNQMKDVLETLGLRLGLKLNGWPENFFEEETPAVVDFDQKWPDFNLNLLRPLNTVLDFYADRFFALQGILTLGDLVQKSEEKVSSLLRETYSAAHTATHRDPMRVRDVEENLSTQYDLSLGMPAIEGWPQQRDDYDTSRQFRSDAPLDAILTKKRMSPEEKWKQILAFLNQEFGADEYSKKFYDVPASIQEKVLAFAQEHPDTVIEITEGYKYALSSGEDHKGWQLVKSCFIAITKDNFTQSARFINNNSKDPKPQIITLLGMNCADLTPMHMNMAIAIIRAKDGLTVEDAKQAYIDGYINDEATAAQIRQDITDDLAPAKDFMADKIYEATFDRMLLDRTRKAVPSLDDKSCMAAFKEVARVLRAEIPFVVCKEEIYHGRNVPPSRISIICKRPG